MFKEFVNDDYTILNFQSLRMKDISELCRRINTLYSEGYIIKEEFTPKECPKIPRLLNLKFEKNPESINTKLNDYQKDNTDLKAEVESLKKDLYELKIKSQDLEEITKKDDLLEYASVYGITIPEDVKIPLAIKKYIKENLDNSEE